MEISGAALTLSGVFVTGWLTYRGSRTAAAIQAEPNQRAADLAAFKEIKEDMQVDINELREETRSLRSLVRSMSGYVAELTAQMRQRGIEPPAPPDRVAEYNRTGV
ncbi:hypothetical protein OHT52_21010 [Streptomyces sp. NBC_00247]|uniref:hypothetical protein n=1 Tax=Streptomyces sp. NBC_00247 TaxID=2975689 RepID=UPI002E27E317|nr:hypothetical protein [Streptomyces sp. NBC_00247]